MKINKIIENSFIDFYNGSGGESPFMHFYGGPYTQYISTQSNSLTINSSGLQVSNGVLIVMELLIQHTLKQQGL